MKPLGLAELRFRLRGAKWKWFRNRHKIKQHGVKYCCSFGLFMGRTCIVITAQRRIVHIQNVQPLQSNILESLEWVTEAVDPTNPKSKPLGMVYDSFPLSFPEYLVSPLATKESDHETDTDV